MTPTCFRKISVACFTYFFGPLVSSCSRWLFCCSKPFFNYRLENYFDIHLYCAFSVEYTFSFARPIFSRIAKKKGVPDEIKILQLGNTTINFREKEAVHEVYICSLTPASCPGNPLGPGGPWGPLEKIKAITLIE